MKKILLLLSFSLLLSGCATNYDVPVQPTQPIKEYPAVVETVQEQPTVNEIKTSLPTENVSQQAEKATNEVNLSNDDSYINVDGNQVHSPAYADSIPSGASAICRDGTYSFSQHRQGTCSGHGGVASWY
jgi:hypothetical protein